MFVLIEKAGSIVRHIVLIHFHGVTIGFWIVDAHSMEGVQAHNSKTSNLFFCCFNDLTLELNLLFQACYVLP